MEKINTNRAALRISVGRPDQFPADPLPQIAFSGRSNVGKSSLINSLLGRKSLARVSSTPGKTVTVNFYLVDDALYLVDLPGYGFARRSPAEKKAWSALTDGYFVKNPNIDRLVAVNQLIDVRVGPTDDDRMMLRFLADNRIPFFITATKCDKLSPSALRTALDAWQHDVLHGIGNIPILPFSAVSGMGKQQVLHEILARL